MENHSFSKKQILFATVLMLMTGFLVKLAISPTIYTFSSRAEQEPETIIYSQDAISLVELPSNDTPKCFQQLQYLPTDPVCYVEFTCLANEEFNSSLLPEQCTYDNGTIYCEGSDTSCGTLNDWKESLSKVCGC